MSVEFQVCIFVFRLQMLRVLHSDALNGCAIVQHCGGRRDSSHRLVDTHPWITAGTMRSLEAGVTQEGTLRIRVTGP